MADKLGISADGCVYRLAWLIEEDGFDCGSLVGEDFYGSSKSPEMRRKAADRLLLKASKASLENYEVRIVDLAVCTMPEAIEDDGAAAFETLTQARKALSVARAAQKQARLEWEQKRPWPEWAQKATAAGWKAPKGWTP